MNDYRLIGEMLVHKGKISLVESIHTAYGIDVKPAKTIERRRTKQPVPKSQKDRDTILDMLDVSVFRPNDSTSAGSGPDICLA